MRELIDAMEDNYSKWQTREGIKNLPEFGGPARIRSRTSSDARERARSAREPPLNDRAIPIRSAVGGWVASTAPSHAGGVGIGQVLQR